MTMLIDETLLIGVAMNSAGRRSKERTERLRPILSEVDMNSYQALENVFWRLSVSERDFQSKKLRIVEVFASSLYSEASKEYFAAGKVEDRLILSVCGQFLTEKIILGYLEGPRANLFNVDYFTALMGSKHLSVQIISAALIRLYPPWDWKALEVIPNLMIIPEVVVSWLAKVSGGSSGGFILAEAKVAAALRIKQVHPEYEGLPDDWVLKVFGVE